MRSDLSFREFTDTAPKLLLLVSEGEIHGASASAIARGGQFYGKFKYTPALDYLYHAGKEKI
jgi:hypothetical protein